MFRLWAKLFKENHMLKDCVIENNESEINRTKKVLGSLRLACDNFDLAEPIWLDMNISEFKRVSKTRFNSDNFIEPIEFDYLEIQVIEEDVFYGK